MANKTKKAKKPDSKPKLPKKPSAPQTYTGFGKTVDEATEAAHGLIPENPKVADEIITSKVVDWGRETGGFAGLNRIYVTVIQV
jgi:hypothetical protein